MRYLMTFCYDGSEYSGYQKQNNEKTIQGTIEEVLSKLSEAQIRIHSSGRTDSKVHALNQTAHFDLNMNISPDKLKKAINSILPDSIYLKSLKEVDKDFHARYDVKKKTYIYKINVGDYDPINRHYIYQYNHKLNISLMKKAIKSFIGTHNFKAYTKGNIIKENYERTIYKAKISANKDIITITITGNGFMRYMVRNIVGSLIEVGSGKLKSKDISSLINSLDRKKVGVTAPACGLYLKEVIY